MTLRRRGLPHPVYAIAMSGYGWKADVLKSTAAGFRHHVLKPVDIDEMDGLLAEAACEFGEVRLLV
jgi:CheY-like chemotaxis protein